MQAVLTNFHLKMVIEIFFYAEIIENMKKRLMPTICQVCPHINRQSSHAVARKKENV